MADEQQLFIPPDILKSFIRDIAATTVIGRMVSLQRAVSGPRPPRVLALIPDMEPMTDEALALIEEEHQPWGDVDYQKCESCVDIVGSLTDARPWPCAPILLVAEVRRLRAEQHRD